MKSTLLLTLGFVFFAFGCSSPKVGTLKLVAELPINPGNLAVSEDGRVFATVHQFRPADARLVEVLGNGEYEPWPNARWNRGFNAGPESFNSLLGIQIDQKDRLWVIDNGLGQPPQPPRLYAFDVDTGKLLFRHQFQEKVGPRGSLIQDLAVDEKNDFVFLADIGGGHEPAIVTVDVRNAVSWRLTGHPSFNAEDVDMVVEGEVLHTQNPDGSFAPARVAINPITLSSDRETLYYGAMNGETWYSVPSALLRRRARRDIIFSAIREEGRKPVSDGASTDTAGDHYFTNLRDNSIDVLRQTGELETLVSSEALLWSDALSFGPDGWLYVAVNQLHRSPFFSRGQERGEPPYTVWKVFTGVDSEPGR